ncbi:MAG TPA: PEGA domain-containing protein [Kofleriaceae bacterium]|jgi:hypothetical protein|nr:PEGA domain-containing protein [Kofleriaceae bacterium]
MTRVLLCLAVLFVSRLAHADDDPKRKVAVLEYRSGSSALVGVGGKLAEQIGKQTSINVLGPQQARTVYGEQLEQAVVKCGGEPDCIAKIGQKLGAAEVILIGVSELGDVILTMQRIDVKTHAVNARIADSLNSNGTPDTEQLSEYLRRLLPPTDFLRFGIIDIVATQDGALVTVGGERRGTTPIQPLKLKAPETYAIKVEKRGFVPFSTKVQLAPDSEIKVEAELSKRTGTAWYQHWYVLAGLGVVVAGAAGTTIYFATQSEDSRLDFKGSVQ